MFISKLKGKRIVFFVQGEGRGHLTQAIATKELIEKHGGIIIAVFVGISPQRNIPQYFLDNFSDKLHYISSPNFIQDKNGKSVRFFYSILHNIIRTPVYLFEILRVHKIITVLKPDLIINFFEILGTIFSLVFGRSIPVVNIAHQYIFLHPDFRFPNNHIVNKLLIKLFTFCTALGSNLKIALSFYELKNDFNKNIFIVPPLLPRDIIDLNNFDKGDHLLIYILNSGYSEDIIKWHTQNPNVTLRCFWDSKIHDAIWEVSSNLTFFKIDRIRFIEELRTCKGIISTAGFESIAEACYLDKFVVAIPVEGHIEQIFNAFDIQSSGLGLSSDHFDMNLLLFLDNPRPTEIKLKYRNWVSCSNNLMESLISSQIKSHQQSF